MTDASAITCLGVIPDCPACVAEYGVRRTRHTDCDDLCRLTQTMKQDPATHELIHRPLSCEHCGALLDDHRGNDRIVTRPCAEGTCRVWACPNCDGEWASDGPVGCKVRSPIEDGETP